MSSFRYNLSSHSEDEKKSSLNLVRESFGNDVDIVYDEYYDWQYLKNPLGRANVLLAYDEERAIGQIASVPCRYNVAGKDTPVISTLNLCVSPQYRGKGIMRELLDRIHKMNQSMFSVGVPNRQSIRGHLHNEFNPMPLTLLIRPIRLSNYFINYRVVGKFLKPFDSVWRKKKTSCKFQIHDHVSMFDERFDDLYLTARDQKMIMQVRDSKFLNWRYKTNPRRKYTTFVAEGDGGNIHGYIVTRIMKISGKRVGLIIDLLTLRNSNSGSSLIVAALDHFWTNCAAFAMVTCFRNSVEFHLTKGEGFLRCPKRFLPHNPLTLCMKPSNEGQNRSELVDPSNWFFMFGDYEVY
jgi:GNAT superfamily N-acetyltransferase